MMKLIHTSDWHLGQSFMGKGRAEEHICILERVVGVISHMEALKERIPKQIKDEPNGDGMSKLELS